MATGAELVQGQEATKERRYLPGEIIPLFGEGTRVLTMTGIRNHAIDGLPLSELPEGASIVRVYGPEFTIQTYTGKTVLMRATAKPVDTTPIEGHSLSYKDNGRLFKRQLPQVFKLLIEPVRRKPGDDTWDLRENQFPVCSLVSAFPDSPRAWVMKDMGAREAFDLDYLTIEGEEGNRPLRPRLQDLAQVRVRISILSDEELDR